MNPTRKSIAEALEITGRILPSPSSPPPATLEEAKKCAEEWKRAAGEIHRVLHARTGERRCDYCFLLGGAR